MSSLSTIGYLLFFSTPFVVAGIGSGTYKENKNYAEWLAAGFAVFFALEIFWMIYKFLSIRSVGSSLFTLKENLLYKKGEAVRRTNSTLFYLLFLPGTILSELLFPRNIVIFVLSFIFFFGLFIGSFYFLIYHCNAANLDEEVKIVFNVIAPLAVFLLFVTTINIKKKLTSRV